MIKQDPITVQLAKTLPALFRERVKRTPQQVAYRYFDKTQKGASGALANRFGTGKFGAG